jgi:glycosyltransferase involved in cell wall biosynthesis
MQSWRVPVFSRLAKRPDLDLCVFHGETFANSKVVNHSGEVDFAARSLKTLKVNFKTSNGPVHLPLNLGLWGALREFNPDVIVTEGASNAFNNLICFIYARVHGRRIVQWGLGRIRGRKPSLFRRLMDLAFFAFIERNSDGAVAYSSLGASYYKEIGVPEDHIFTAVNTVDTDARQSAAEAYALLQGRSWPSPPPAQFHILFVGALTHNKGVDILLKAFARLVADGHDPRLTIVGDGVLRGEFEALALQLGVQDRTRFAGHVSGDIAQYFLDATVMVLPGLGGLAVSDALCHGVPVICGVGDGSESDLVNGRNGRILDPLNEQTLTEVLRELQSSPALQKEWRDHARDVIVNQYNIHSYVASIEDCIKKVAG